MTTGGYFVYDPDHEPVTWTAEERARGQFWGVQTIESFHTYGTPDVLDGVAMHDLVQYEILPVRQRPRTRPSGCPSRPADRHLLAEARARLTVEVATRLRALGHAVTVHLAARMVRDRDAPGRAARRDGAGGDRRRLRDRRRRDTAGSARSPPRSSSCRSSTSIPTGRDRSGSPATRRATR